MCKVLFDIFKVYLSSGKNLNLSPVPDLLSGTFLFTHPHLQNFSLAVRWHLKVQKNISCNLK